MASTIVAHERLSRKLKWTSIISDDFKRELLEAVYEGYVEGIEDGKREVRDKESLDRRMTRKEKALKQARGES